MQVGDLVKRKTETCLNTANSLENASKIGLVYSIAGKGVKIYMSDGNIKVGLVDHWLIVQKNAQLK